MKGKCLQCKEECDNFYPAFKWTGQSCYRIKDHKICVHKKCYGEWYKKQITELAEFDQVMNYCEYFERIEGNTGFYRREGKEIEVNGTWDEYLVDGTALFPHTEVDMEKIGKFRSFLSKNGWSKDWFRLKEKYR